MQMEEIQKRINEWINYWRCLQPFDEWPYEVEVSHKGGRCEDIYVKYLRWNEWIKHK